MFAQLVIMNTRTKTGHVLVDAWSQRKQSSLKLRCPTPKSVSRGEVGGVEEGRRSVCTR